jgi:hypothetical protein
MTIEIQKCDHCGTSVVPKANGHCPACQARIATPRVGHESHSSIDAPDARLVENDVRRLADRAFHRGLWSLLTSLTIVLIPVGWWLAFSARRSFQDARLLVQSTRQGQQYMGRARVGAWLALFPLLILALILVAGFLSRHQ